MSFLSKLKAVYAAPNAALRLDDSESSIVEFTDKNGDEWQVHKGPIADVYKKEGSKFEKYGKIKTNDYSLKNLERKIETMLFLRN